MEQTRNQYVPRARHEELLIHELTDEVLVYDLRHHKAHSLNQTAALVWGRCDGERCVSDIAHLLEDELGTPVDEDVVWLALNQLERVGLLKERATRASETLTIRRRELIRKMGLAAAASLPLVVSVVAPSAAQAASGMVPCLPTGAQCTQDTQCCSGLCLGQGNGTCHS